MRLFWHQFSIDEKTGILDVGGTESSWLILSRFPKVVILNIHLPVNRDHRFLYVVADGGYLPFKKGAFALVYSNSMIEHVENLEKQLSFASECVRVGRRYYVQTPNRWFFIEPHLITPFAHWFPLKIQKILLRNFTLWGWITRPTHEQCADFLNHIRLLDEGQAAPPFS